MARWASKNSQLTNTSSTVAAKSASRPLFSCIVFAFLAFLFPFSTPSAEEYSVKRDQGLAVFYFPRHETQAESSLCILLQAREETAHQLGLPESASASIVLVPTQERFEALIGRDRAHLRLLGIASTPNRQILINLSQLTPSGESNLYETLVHEMVHILLGVYEQEHFLRLPRWFHEGVACRLSRALPSHPDDRRLLVAANLGKLLPFYDLDKDFPEFSAGTELAYLQSEDFIRFLVDRHGPKTIPLLLQALAEHRELRTAFPAAFGVDLLEEERAWAGDLKSAFPLLFFIQEYFTLFTAAALLTFLSFLFYRRRRARILKKWELEEPPQMPQPPPPAPPETPAA